MFIKEITLKNFKSFKSADAVMSNGFNCVVGPNGSGKSNVIDGLLFAFGESSLKSMRVKRIPDLIYQSHDVAEVTVVLQGRDGAHNIKRLLRKDGKAKYKLDGKTTKKYVVQEFLAHHHLSLHNIIKQGEVQRIIDMNPKDRRTLIDSVANVSEYEQKKQEAYGELEKVQERLRESAAILNEREGFLQGLEKEKIDAERYVELKKQLDVLKASILTIDLNVLGKEFESALAAVLDLQNKIDAVRKTIAEIEQKISSKLQEKQFVHEQIMQRSQGKQLVLEKEVQELSTAIERAKALIEEKKAQIQRNDGRTHELKLDLTRAGDEVRGVTAQLKSAREELEAVQKIYDVEKAKYDRVIKDTDSFTKEFFKARQELEKANAEMQAIKDQLNALQAEVSLARETAKMKEAELQRLKTGEFEDFDAKKAPVAERGRQCGHELKKAEKELEVLYAREKSLNAELKDVEESLLKSKQKVFEVTSRLKHAKEFDVSRALEAVLGLAEKEKGIYGTLDQLCKYESKYAVPIQVALGPRVNYVVVDNVRTATKAIDFLKAGRMGRVSFIPLDKINAVQVGADDKAVAKKAGANGLGFLIDLVEFDNRFARAFQYAFGNTLLVSSLKQSNELVGQIRFVSMEGDLAESSGLVSGGSASERINLIKEKAELEAAEKRAAESDSAKKAVLDGLDELRDRMSASRKLKAEWELKLKTAELELANIDEQEKKASEKAGNINAALSQLKKEIKALEEKANNGDDQRTELIKKLSDLNIFALDCKQKIDLEKEQTYGIAIKEKEKHVSDLKIKLSELGNHAAGLETQYNVYEKQFNSFKKQEEQLNSETDEARKMMRQLDEEIKSNSKQSHEKQAELKTISGALKDLYEKRDELEKQAARLGNDKGKLEFEREKLERSMNEFNMTRVRHETNLANIKAEYDQYSSIEVPDKEKLLPDMKPELLVKAKQSDEAIAAIGPVNLKAVEEYATRSKDLAEQKGRVKQLFEEKEAVIGMINEIEGKKINTFKQTFDIINKNFEKLFSQIFKGQGRLYLENPENPFEGGLTIEVRLDKGEVKYLELMSGGEKSLVALMFLFAIQSYNPSSIYVLDEADAALDQENSRKLALLLKELSRASQFLVVSHNQHVYRDADCLMGVAMGKDGSKIVEVKLNEGKAAGMAVTETAAPHQ